MHGRKTLQNSERGDTNSTWEQSCIDDASKVQKTVLVRMRARVLLETCAVFESPSSHQQTSRGQEGRAVAIL